MQTSKIFMGASAFVLAIAGAFATKASSKFTQVTAWSRFNTVNHSCHVAITKVACDSVSAGQKCRKGAKTLYTKIACQNTLRTIVE